MLAITAFPLPLPNLPPPGFVLSYEKHTDRSDFEDLAEYTPAEKCEQAVRERDKFLGSSASRTLWIFWYTYARSHTTAMLPSRHPTFTCEALHEWVLRR